MHLLLRSYSPIFIFHRDLLILKFLKLDDVTFWVSPKKHDHT